MNIYYFRLVTILGDYDIHIPTIPLMVVGVVSSIDDVMLRSK